MDYIQDGALISYNVVVPKSNDSIALAFEPARTFRIMRLNALLGVLRTVNFDDQMSRHAGKVDNVGSDRDLSTKVAFTDFHTPQVSPKNSFDVRRIRAQAVSDVAPKARDGSSSHVVHRSLVTPPRRLRRRPSPSRGG
jgi:hypothetical protein